LAIAASPIPPEMAKGAGYDASRTASHRDLSWHPFFSTSTSMTCQPSSGDSRNKKVWGGHCGAKEKAVGAT